MSTAVSNPIDSVGTRGLDATGYNFRVCENCGHDLRQQMAEYGAQLWACNDCGSIRQWGDGRPESKKLRPLLKCDDCRCPTRHGFIGVIGQTL
jgi:hypothetical protein